MKYTEKILEEASMIVEEIITDKNFSIKVNPFTLTIVSIMLAFLVAFTNNYIMILFSIPILITIYLLLSVNKSHFVKILFIVSLLGTIPGIPIIFTSTGYINSLNDLVLQPTSTGLENFIVFVSRVIVSSLFFILPIIGLGWYGFLKSLSRLKPLRVFLSIISLVIVILPRIIRNMLSIMFAREARIISKNYRVLWRTISSAIGDTIIVSHEYAGKLTKAITARTITNIYFYETKKRRYRYNYIDLMLILGTTTYIILYILVETSWLKLC